MHPNSLENDFIAIIFSILFSLSSITMFAICLCCRKRIPKNDLMGLEGIVKINDTSESESPLQRTRNDVTASGTLVPITSTLSLNDQMNNEDSKRMSTAPHRSLPDIPITEPTPAAQTTGDNSSDLYATVEDKRIDKRSEDPTQTIDNKSVKKLSNISQHSSFSQGDESNSPYARVHSMQINQTVLSTANHAYDTVRSAEHPYAKLKATVAGETVRLDEDIDDDLDDTGQIQIPAASAIAGRISASQELPYMTPPIVAAVSLSDTSNAQQSHPQEQQSTQFFSGDSQDSSKGYTSITVREPLATIIAQTNQLNAAAAAAAAVQEKPKQATIGSNFDIIDSHYATVSDDSDEMYAAIEESGKKFTSDLYASGSETYAQIQSPAQQMTVIADINYPPAVQPSTSSVQSSVPSAAPVPTPMTASTIHSRQASSSSSIGIMGSPKPEKRQANSPLPPTPKKSDRPAATNRLSYMGESIKSGTSSNGSIPASITGDDTQHLQPPSPVKKANFEGMYAKVMKKGKFSNAPASENTSPVPIRKMNRSEIDDVPVTLLNVVTVNQPSQHISTPNISTVRLDDRSDGELDDGNYETIPVLWNKDVNNFESMANCSATTLLPGRCSAPAGLLAQEIHRVSENSLNIFKTITDRQTTVTVNGGYESLTDHSDPLYSSIPPDGVVVDPSTNRSSPNNLRTDKTND